MGRRAVLGPGNTAGKKMFKKSTKSKVARVTKPARKAIVAIAKQVLNRELETKYTCAQNSYAFNSAVTSYSECYPCLPAIFQTAASAVPGQTHTRLGTQVSPVTSKVDMTVAIYSVSRTVAVQCDVWVVVRKLNRYWPDVSAIGSSASPQIFLTGASGTGTANYSGGMTNAKLRVNTNEFTVLHHKRFNLLGNVGLPNGDTSTGNAPNVAAHASKTFSMRLKCPKTLKYDENVGSTANSFPNNYAPFLMVGYSKLDGSTPDLLNTSLIASWNVSLTYKDA